MSYVYILFVYTQYLRQQINWLCSLFFPIVQTVKKSLDLLAGFGLLQLLSTTQVEARILAGYLVMFSQFPFFPTESFIERILRKRFTEN